MDAPAPTPCPPRAAARKYFCDTARGGFWRRERLFFQGSRSAILGVSSNWGYEHGSDMTGRVVAGWGIECEVDFAVGRNGG